VEETGGCPHPQGLPCKTSSPLQEYSTVSDLKLHHISVIKHSHPAGIKVDVKTL